MEELRLVLMGKTGSGKSSTGNTIVGEEVFEHLFSASSVTNVCQRHDVTRNGKKVVVVDTPGFFDTSVPQEKVTQEISRCISMTTPGVHAFLFVIGMGRFTDEEGNTVQLFFKQFGENIEKYMIVVFTHGDALCGTPVDKYLSTAPSSLQKVIETCDGRYIVIDNKDKPQGQVDRLLELVDKTVKDNGGKCYTNPMYDENIKMLERQEEEAIKKFAEEERQKIQKIEKVMMEKFSVQMKENERKSSELQNQIYQYQSDIKSLREVIDKKSEIYNDSLSRMEQLNEKKEAQQSQYIEQISTLNKQIDNLKGQQFQHSENIRSLNKEYSELTKQQIKDIKISHKHEIKRLRKENKDKFDQLTTAIQDGNTSSCVIM